MAIHSLSDRVRGMIWGQFVGDAAALGTHWIYDLGELQQRYPGGVQGFEAPAAGHYHQGKKSGDQTHYGDAALLLLESVAAAGELDLPDFGRRFVAFFGSPACTSYKDHATRETLERMEADPGNYRNGADDNQPGAVTRLAPVVAVHGSAPAVIETLTRFTHNNDEAVAYATAHARVLSALLEGAELHAAFSQVEGHGPSAAVAQAMTAIGTPVIEATARFGQSCPLPSSFPAAVHAAASSPEDFRRAILEIIGAGGDSAARASMAGAWLGASLGEEGIPAEWVERLTLRARIEEAIQRLLTKIAA